jgi:osmotically-inducible protein OsmY
MRNYRDDDRRDFGGDDRFQSMDRDRWNEEGGMRRGQEGYGMPSWNREEGMRGREQNWSGYRDDDQRGSFGSGTRGHGGESWRERGGYDRDRYEGRGMDRWEGGQSFGRHEGRGERGWEGGGRDFEERWGRGYEGSRMPSGRGFWDERGEGNRSFGGGFESGRGFQGGYENRGFQGGGYESGRGFQGGGYEGRGFQGGSSFGQSDRSQWGYGQMGQGQTYQGGMGQMGSGRFGQQQQGRMQARGPKGYKRSDERIKEDVCECLSQGHIDASEIEITVKNGEVTLTGTADDRRTKRMAEELIDDVSGVQEVHNQIRVKREETRESKESDMTRRQTQQGGNANAQRS